MRAHLLRLAVASFVPLLVFSVVLLVLLAEDARETIRDSATDRTLALLTALDTELKRSVAALEALATSDRLRTAQLAEFRAEMERVWASRSEWLTIHLAQPGGQEVIDLLAPAGSPLHEVVDADTLDDVVEHRAPRVGNLIREPITGRQAFPVRVPVVHEGEVAYVLTALVESEVAAAILSPQGLQDDWVGVVLDRNETIVARTVAPETMVGRPAAPSLRAALAQAPRGWFHGSTLEGWDVYTPFHRSAFSGWTVALGIPASAVEASLVNSLMLLVVCGVLSLLAAFGVAWLLSRRTAASLEELIEGADEVGATGGATTSRLESAVPSGVAEVDRLREAWLEAAHLVRARSEERDRVEASLRAAEAELRETDRRKDEFMAMLGHELRNPLGVIGTSVQLLRRKAALDPADERVGEMMERQVQHMTRLLDDLLDAARIAAGRIQLGRKRCDFVAIARQTAQDYERAFADSGVTLEVSLPDHPLWVDGDPTRLAQIVANLLHNANKFTDRGGTVHLRVRQEPVSQNVSLTVADTGVGMASDTLEHVFQAFTQADGTIERSRGGLGLGLALVKGLAELHGGSVEATSAGLGKGSEFIVRLPLDVDATGPDVEPPAAADDSARTSKILVVEDNRMAAEAMTMFLSGRGHEVRVAHSGPDGIAAAERFVPEVVLCDIGLPGADGYQVARAIRGGAGREALLIAVTGYGQESDRQRATEAGFDRFLTKPIDFPELQRLLTGTGAATRSASKQG